MIRKDGATVRLALLGLHPVKRENIQPHHVDDITIENSGNELQVMAEDQRGHAHRRNPGGNAGDIDQTPDRPTAFGRSYP